MLGLNKVDFGLFDDLLFIYKILKFKMSTSYDREVIYPF